MLPHGKTAVHPPRPEAQDGDLARKVSLYLAAARPELGALRVDVQGTAVRLSGTLRSFYLRQLAVACVGRVAGVHKVIDELDVA